MTENQSKFSRRAIALFWLVLVSIAIGILLYLEQIAILYVIASIGLVLLLIVVGFADLEKVGQESADGFARKAE